jgi:4-hydroxybenzoate polyprenyltransferase
MQATLGLNGRVTALGRALRPHHWAKNLLVFVPLVTAHRTAMNDIAAALLAFAAFSAFASSAYLVNDILDLAADREHPRKRLRALPSGTLPVSWAATAAAILFAVGASIAVQLATAAFLTLLLYPLLSLAYSLSLKRRVLLDVIVLAGLYTLRIIVGGQAAEAPASAWLLAFSMFAFFSLALLKRHAELVSLESDARAPGRGYVQGDTALLVGLGSASAVVSVLVLALYTNGDTVRQYYAQPELLGLLCPLFLYWLGRAWFLSVRGQMHDDPIVFAIRDPASYAIGAAAALVLLAATLR